MRLFIMLGMLTFVVIACKGYQPLVPAETQLNAIKPKYEDVTLDKLNTGYKIYTESCVKCHKPKKIHNYSEEKWPGIINVMAKKAKIDGEQKDAVLKYVLSVKASQSIKSK